MRPGSCAKSPMPTAKLAARRAARSRTSTGPGSIGSSLLHGRGPTMPRIRPAADPPPDGRPAEAPVLRFPTFEGLRALAAVAVLVFHAATFTTTLAGESRGPAELGAWIQNLNVGVSLFFVLSGFLLFRPFVLAHLTGAAGPATRPYLLRRLVRIFPAYWVALFVTPAEPGSPSVATPDPASASNASTCPW